VNRPLLLAMPAGTVVRPVVAPVGTLVTIMVAVSDVMSDGVPLNTTAVAPERFSLLWSPRLPPCPRLG
jgi:hypothetical protein